MKRFLVLTLFSILAGAILLAFLAGNGSWGYRQPVGEIVDQPRPAAAVVDSLERQAVVREIARPGSQKQILFGDLHAHTTFSFDAYNISLPLAGGEGSHPPADACDFARFCSALDFWSINDHAEGLTPRQWSLTRDMVRSCNAASGNPSNPDLVTYLGWEWTQIGDRPENHYGHKNVIIKDTGEDAVPRRPISSRAKLFPSDDDPFTLPMRLLLLASAGNSEERQRYHDFIRFLNDKDELGSCDTGVPVRDLPTDCQESAATPQLLFEKLDDWGYPYLVIPHGNTWGFYTPALSSWDKQLRAHTEPDRHEPLIEVFSGHGNIEEYRPWRARIANADGSESCPPPTEGFLPECWRAGQIIEQRCLEAGDTGEDCASRAAATRDNFLLSKDAGHWTIPGAGVTDWLEAGQCTDCYMPAYNHRPALSVQYGLAIRDFTVEDQPPKRFRWGMIGSSDIHTARPGTGYKEFRRRGGMSDAALGTLGPPPILRDNDPRAEFIEQDATVASQGANFERFASFFGTGGLIAVHSEGRDRESIWDAMERKEVYATSGDRILLWFGLDAGGGSTIPMGSSTRLNKPPSFNVQASGAFEQLPGCPAETKALVSEDRLERLCYGECYHPSDRRKRIERIEVVRILPQKHPGESVDLLIEDPWQVIPCEGDGPACSVNFSDPEFADNARDAVYYVRAIQEPSPTVNGNQLRCEERDANGQCLRVDPCLARGATSLDDDCLAEVSERAWSSPIFVDWQP